MIEATMTMADGTVVVKEFRSWLELGAYKGKHEEVGCIIARQKGEEDDGERKDS